MTEHCNYIARQWVEAQDQAPNINPSDTNDIIGHYPMGNAAGREAAIAAASEAAPGWAARPALERFEVLDRIGSTILDQQDALGDMLAQEEGKTLSEARAEAHRGLALCPRGADAA